MKRKFFCMACLWLGLLCHPLYAQTLAKAEATYAQFNKLRASGGSEASIYDALYHSYTDYLSVLNASGSDTPEYAASKRALREMLPFLQMGAAWSSNNRQMSNAILFAQAYMDIHLMPAFSSDAFIRDERFSQMAYFAASGTFNAGQYQKAIPYFRAYLDSGIQKDRENVYAYMAKACMEAKEYEMAMEVINEATNSYPNNYNMLSMAINNCLDRKDNTNLQLFVEKAIKLRPDDIQLLNIQGKMYEDIQEFQKALAVFNRLDKMKPNNLGIAKHLACNYYNLAVTYFNKALMEQSESVSKRYTRQSNDYFSAASTVLENVVANDPGATAYAEALAIAYSCLKEREKLETANNRLVTSGIKAVDENTVPVLLAYDNTRPASPSPSPQPNPTASFGDTPKYSSFAKDYVMSRIKKWQEKNEFETIDEYQARVTEQSREAKKQELLKLAEQEYIKTYTKNVRFNEMVLKQYDAENNSYLVESQYGELIVPVPRSNNEAQVFKSSWSGMQFKNPSFYISNDQLLLSKLTFVTPTGKSYVYDNSKDLAYQETVVDINFDPIQIDTNPSGNYASNTTRNKEKVIITGGKSDVDINIPETKVSNEKTFAYIIGNEDYEVVSSVQYAKNDGRTFAEYCQKTLGLPKENVKYRENVTFGKLLNLMAQIKSTAKAYNGDLNIIFYYAGHGIPNEETKDAYILPTDADGRQTEGCYSLNRLYEELGGLNAHQVVVFLDACFSGAKRDGEMIADARGVALKFKPGKAQGNMVIFSAATDDQTALPWDDKGHGLFTYFLLKKMQESKGDVTLKELGDYIRTNVSQKATNVNNKEQTPTVIASDGIGSGWEKKRLKP